MSARITLEGVEAAYAAWRQESDNTESTYRSRMDAYGRATELHKAYKVQGDGPMSATPQVQRWSESSVLDLIDAADKDETTAVTIANHPHATSEDLELAAFMLDRAEAMRAEITRRIR